MISIQGNRESYDLFHLYAEQDKVRNRICSHSNRERREKQEYVFRSRLHNRDVTIHE